MIIIVDRGFVHSIPFGYGVSKTPTGLQQGPYDPRSRSHHSHYDLEDSNVRLY